jgi:uncharacterized protein YbaP (TraB family)
MPTYLSLESNRLKMTAILLSLMFTLLISTGLDARQNQQAVTQKHCLWEVETSTNKVFLLGSLHLLKSDAYPLAAEIDSAYGLSPKVVFETDIGAMEDPAVQARMLNMAMYPEGQTLLQHIPQEMQKALKKKLADLGLPLEPLVRFKPWFLAVTLTTLELQRLGFSPLSGIDVHYYGRASSDEKELDFFESIDYQLDLLGNMSADDQKSFLGQTLKDLEIAAQMADDMMRYWQNGQVEKLHSLLFKSFEDYPQIEDRLLLQRNKDWVEKIEVMLGGPENVFVVVGAGHLVGPRSVIDLLRQKGYKVKQK